MNDGNCIKAALDELGYEYEEHKHGENLYGYQGDKRQQKAHIIIRREHVGTAANDVGFLRGSNGKYEMIISEFDRRSGKQSDNFMNKLKQIYTKHSFMKQAKKMGYIVNSQKTDENGRIKIKVSRSY